MKYKTNILSDSTCRLFNFREISRHVNMQGEEVDLTKYAGATVEKLNHMAKFFIENNKPDNLIIVGGINNIMNDRREKKNTDAISLAEGILNIARFATQNGVGRVCVSELIKPIFVNTHRLIDEVNNLLSIGCTREDFVLIDQSNIGRDDLTDHIHVSQSGNQKLKHNVLRNCMNYINLN